MIHSLSDWDHGSCRASSTICSDRGYARSMNACAAASVSSLTVPPPSAHTWLISQVVVTASCISARYSAYSGNHAGGTSSKPGASVTHRAIQPMYEPQSPFLDPENIWGNSSAALRKESRTSPKYRTKTSASKAWIGVSGKTCA